MPEETLSILLVEDDNSHVELIIRALEGSELGIELKVCVNLDDARQSIKSNMPDLVITDLYLPGGRGVELIDNLQSEKSYPVILMTSFGDEKIAVDAIKSGALDYVVKSAEAFKRLPTIISRVMREWRHITAELRAQAALLLKERDQKEILNAIVDAVIMIDGDGKILSFSNAAETMFGYASNEIIGQNIKTLMPDVYGHMHDDYIQRYRETGDAHVIGSAREVEGLHKSNVTFPIRLSLAELSKNEKGMRRFIGSCQDLTFIKQQEEQLRHAQKMDALDQLIGGIAHDYNNMLAVILGYAELLEEGLSTQLELARYVHEILHAGERGTKLTGKILAFSRQAVLDASVLDINALLRGQRLMLEKTLTVRITLVFDLAEQLWPVWLDKGELEDAIVNMSINAMHAMDGSGHLTIRTRNEPLSVLDAQTLPLDAGDYVLLSITDTGCGMDDKTKEKIFDPFFSTKGDKGTGLGLSQVYGFMQRSGGAIQVYSKSGQGSRFALYFPRSRQSVCYGIDKTS